MPPAYNKRQQQQQQRQPVQESPIKFVQIDGLVKQFNNIYLKS